MTSSGYLIVIDPEQERDQQRNESVSPPNFVRKRRGCVFEKTEARSRYDLVNLMWNVLVPVKFEAPANG